MKSLPSVTIAVGLCAAALWMARAATSQEMIAQTGTPTKVPSGIPSSLPAPAGSVHRVVGRVQLPHNCGNPMTISLRETWFTAPVVPSGSASITRLAHPSNLPVGLLNRQLGTGTVNASTGEFVIEWQEPAFADRLPWGPARTISGESVVAYRLLTLFARGGSLVGYPAPDPMIVFLGTETTKDVRLVKVNCFNPGG